MSSVTRGSSTSASQIEVDWTALTSNTDIGGTSLLSYLLEMNSGLGFQPIVGLTSPYLATSYIVTSGINPGSTYIFRISARNI